MFLVSIREAKRLERIFFGLIKMGEDSDDFYLRYYVGHNGKESKEHC